MSSHDGPEIQYPRRRVIRRVLREISRALFAVLTRLEVKGAKNLPEGGPLLVAANHFSYTDPAVVVRVTPWPLEVLGGFHQPNAPFWGGWILKLWGHLPVHRGTGARGALRSAEAVLAQGGIVGIAPEGGSWAAALRPARPGAAYLAVRSGARILPVGIEGSPDIFPGIRKGRRARVTVQIGRPLGPFRAEGRGQERRRQLDEIGHEIMQAIAELLPPERRGYYSDDPAIRAAARGTEVYPWQEEAEI
jgi:1-acyl-sn-glycerol-3-phosphate acyltransferase